MKNECVAMPSYRVPPLCLRLRDDQNVLDASVLGVCLFDSNPFSTWITAGTLFLLICVLVPTVYFFSVLESVEIHFINQCICTLVRRETEIMPLVK